MNRKVTYHYLGHFLYKTPNVGLTEPHTQTVPNFLFQRVIRLQHEVERYNAEVKKMCGYLDPLSHTISVYFTTGATVPLPHRRQYELHRHIWSNVQI
jgi:uncharacterized membrane protein